MFPRVNHWSDCDYIITIYSNWNLFLKNTGKSGTLSRRGWWGSLSVPLLRWKYPSFFLQTNNFLYFSRKNISFTKSVKVVPYWWGVGWVFTKSGTKSHLFFYGSSKIWDKKNGFIIYMYMEHIFKLKHAMSHIFRWCSNIHQDSSVTVQLFVTS